MNNVNFKCHTHYHKNERNTLRKCRIFAKSVFIMLVMINMYKSADTTPRTLIDHAKMNPIETLSWSASLSELQNKLPITMAQYIVSLRSLVNNAGVIYAKIMIRLHTCCNNNIINTAF